MKKILAIVFLLVVFLTGCIIDKPKIKDTSNATELITNCINTSTGYECTYQNATEHVYNLPIEMIEADEDLKKQCETRGGKYKCYGFCASTYTRFCDFPYEDAAEPCADNSECLGFCVADDYECKSNCTGTCAKYRMNLCDNVHEIQNGTVYNIGVLCD